MENIMSIWIHWIRVFNYNNSTKEFFVKYIKAVCLVFLLGSMSLTAMEVKKSKQSIRIWTKTDYSLRQKYEIECYKNKPNQIKILCLGMIWMPATEQKDFTVRRIKSKTGVVSFIEKETIENEAYFCTITRYSFLDDNGKEKSTFTINNDKPKQCCDSRYALCKRLFKALDEKIKQLEQEKTD